MRSKRRKGDLYMHGDFSDLDFDRVEGTFDLLYMAE